MSKLYFTTFTVVAVLLCIAGCKKFDKIEGVDLGDWNPDVALSLFTTTVNVADVLEDAVENSELVTDDMNALTFVYPSDPFYLSNDELTDLIPSNKNFTMNDTLYHLLYTLTNGLSMEVVDIKSGQLGAVVLNNVLTEPVNFTLTIDEYTKDGIPFDTTIFVANGNIPTFKYFDATGYSLAPVNDTVHFHYKTHLVSDGSEVNLGNPVLILLDSMRHTYAEGYLGQIVYPVPRDTIEIRLFDLFEEGNIYFEEPSLTISVNNSFGFPTRAKFEEFNAITDDGTVIPLGNAQLNQGIDINYPTLNQVGQFAATSFVVDQSNSNLEDMVGQPIRYIDYEFIPTANPDEDPSIIGFVTDSSAVSLDMILELPLYGKSNNFTVLDTMDFDLQDADDRISSAKFRLETENSFPVEIKVQLYFLDQNAVVIDSLNTNFEESIVAAAPIDMNGKSIGISEKRTDIEMNASRFAQIKATATNVLLKASVTTADQGQTSVRIYADNELTLKLGLLTSIDF